MSIDFATLIIPIAAGAIALFTVETIRAVPLIARYFREVRR